MVRLCELPEKDAKGGMLVNPEEVSWVAPWTEPGVFVGEVVRRGSRIKMRDGALLYCPLSPTEVNAILGVSEEAAP